MPGTNGHSNNIYSLLVRIVCNYSYFKFNYYNHCLWEVVLHTFLNKKKMRLRLSKNFPTAVVLTGGWFWPPKRHWQCLERCPWLSQLGVQGDTDIYWVEAKDAAKHSTPHRTASATVNYPAHTVSSAKTEKPWPRVMDFLGRGGGFEPTFLSHTFIFFLLKPFHFFLRIQGVK